MFYSNPRPIPNEISSKHLWKEERDAICSKCGYVIGQQTNTLPYNPEFKFKDEKDNYTYCPCCNHKLNAEKNTV